jgi:Glycosyltransferase family 87
MADGVERSRATRFAVLGASGVVFVVFPLAALFGVFDAIADDRVTPDSSLIYYPAAEALLDGERIYPVRPGVLISDYIYPPVTAVAVAPLTVLSVDAAELVFAVLLVLAFAATLAVAGVRDWRCYGLAFLWPPVLDAIQTGNVTIFLGLGTALVWRLRDRPRAAGAALGIGLAVKPVMWPLAVWLAATRRSAGVLWTVVAAVTVLAATWAVLGFEGLGGYPDLVRRSAEVYERQSYTVYALAIDLGLGSTVGRVLWLALAGGTLALTVVAARRGSERRAFVVAIAATIACSPIVWLHYFALLLVAAAVAQPRLAPVWFLGLPMHAFVTTGFYNGSTFQTAAMLTSAAVTVLLLLGWPSMSRSDLRRLLPRTVVGSP